MKFLDSHPILTDSSKPVIWHTGLHMGNIYVSPNDPAQIFSLMDWQSISVLPLFLQARWPVLLEPPQHYVRGFEKPALPYNFDKLDPEEQLAMYGREQTVAAKAYEVSSFLENRPAYTAMKLPRVFRELLMRCGETSEVGVLPLRACLIEICENWS
jgi:aminoglycoside phosphotransferase (APT) family kinase protein